MIQHSNYFPAVDVSSMDAHNALASVAPGTRRAGTINNVAIPVHFSAYRAGAMLTRVVCEFDGGECEFTIHAWDLEDVAGCPIAMFIMDRVRKSAAYLAACDDSGLRVAR